MPSGPLAATLRDTHALFAAGTVAGLNDDELLRRFAARRDAVAEVAFAALVARHGPMVLAVCRRALADQHEAEDAFQTTFLVLARRASSVRGATLGPWLYGVARRVARRARADALRCRANRGFDQRELKLVNGAGEDVASAAERAEVVVLVDEELAQLSGRDRAALILCDLGGLTHEQAAERLGWPVGTVKSRQARARGRLRARLARRG
ncbi:MAG: sigma-70 family RNA polymerase sigma factor, partial [Isosphaeraceae bacterium]|nr:sigma-70 family RNA polymerase sigma factor [Isosphaeraceae bacterium]